MVTPSSMFPIFRNISDISVVKSEKAYKKKKPSANGAEGFTILDKLLRFRNLQSLECVGKE